MWGEWYHLNVTVHLLAAMYWLGGMFFFALVGAPVLREIDSPDVRARLFQRLGERFRTTGWVAIAVLLVTGTLNLEFRGLLRTEVLADFAFWATPFGRTLGWKLVAVTTMLVASGLHDFLLGPRASRMDAGSPAALRARRRAALLARANALLGLLVIVLAVRLARG